MARSRPQSKPVINLGTRATSSGPLLQQNKLAISHFPPVLFCYLPTLLSFCKLHEILTGGVFFKTKESASYTMGGQGCWENRAHTWTQSKESELLHAPGEAQLLKYSIQGINFLIAQLDFFFLCGSKVLLLIFNTEKLEGLYVLVGFDLYQKTYLELTHLS